jgi:hypothetical protein
VTSQWSPLGKGENEMEPAGHGASVCSTWLCLSPVPSLNRVSIHHGILSTYSLEATGRVKEFKLLTKNE